MFFKNKSVKRILIKILIAFVIVAVAEYMVITLLSSYPLISFKLQAIIAVSIIAFLVRCTYKIWLLYNLDHPLAENGKDKQ